MPPKPHTTLPEPEDGSKLDQFNAKAPVTLTGKTEDKPVDLKRRQQQPILLFDLNGSLTYSTAKKKSKGKTHVRPGAELLAGLARKARVGIFSSSMRLTVNMMRQLIEQATGGRPVFENSLVLSRAFTIPAPNAAGSAWDTAKPLHKWFSRLDRVLMFDDDDHKALDSEKGNLVLVPKWEGNDNDEVLKELIKAVDEVLSKVGPADDIRQYAASITERLRQVADRQQQQQATITQVAAAGSGSGGSDSAEGSSGDDTNAAAPVAATNAEAVRSSVPEALAPGTQRVAAQAGQAAQHHGANQAVTGNSAGQTEQSGKDQGHGKQQREQSKEERKAADKAARKGEKRAEKAASKAEQKAGEAAAKAAAASVAASNGGPVASAAPGKVAAAVHSGGAAGSVPAAGGAPIHSVLTTDDKDGKHLSKAGRKRLKKLAKMQAALGKAAVIAAQPATSGSHPQPASQPSAPVQGPGSARAAPAQAAVVGAQVELSEKERGKREKQELKARLKAMAAEAGGAAAGVPGTSGAGSRQPVPQAPSHPHASSTPGAQGQAGPHAENGKKRKGSHEDDRDRSGKKQKQGKREAALSRACR